MGAHVLPKNDTHTGPRPGLLFYFANPVRKKTLSNIMIIRFCYLSRTVADLKSNADTPTLQYLWRCLQEIQGKQKLSPARNILTRSLMLFAVVHGDVGGDANSQVFLISTQKKQNWG